MLLVFGSKWRPCHASTLRRTWQKGRQIYLPPDEKNNKRKLAWVHSLCAQALGNVGLAKGCFYGCSPDGYYSPDDLECQFLAEDESINSDLDVEPQTGIHHYVCWGYLGQNDEYTRGMVESKLELKNCIYCGKNDSGTVILEDGSEVFRSLRVAVQCSANNDGELPELKQYHQDEGYGPCTQAMHIGCAMWGRNDAGEYSRARRMYFFPGKKTVGPAVEIYCDLHARDLFANKVAGSSMENRLPGPFSAISVSPHKGANNKKKLGNGANIGAGANKNATLTTNTSKISSSAGNPSVPGQSRRGSGLAPNLTLHGHTKKKAARELAKAGEAVAIQTGKHGRLATSQRNSRAVPEKIAAASSQQVREEPSCDSSNMIKVHWTQSILNSLVLEKEKREKQKRPFDASISATLRIQWRNKWKENCILPDSMFSDVWKEAIHAVKQSGVEELQANLSRKMSFAQSQSDPAGSNNTWNGNQGKGSYGCTEQASKERIEESSLDSACPLNALSQTRTGTAAGGELEESSATIELRDDSETEKHMQDLLQRITEPLIAELNQLEVRRNEQGANESAVLTEAVEILLERKKQWKKNSELSKVEFKSLWWRCLREIERRTSFIFAGKRSEGDTGIMPPSRISNYAENMSATQSSQDASKLREQILQRQGDARWDEVNIGHHSKCYASQATEESVIGPSRSGVEATSVYASTSRQLDSTGSNDNDKQKAGSLDKQTSSFEKGDLAPARQQSALPAVAVAAPAPAASTTPRASRWSFLEYGPDFDREGYHFDKWDTFEENVSDDC